MSRDISLWVNDRKYPANDKNGKQIKEYGAWKNMKERCTCSKDSRLFKNYGDCYASENFMSYSYFYEWCQKQKGFHIDGSQLDKDLLKKGNKVYSEDFCAFLPKEINKFLVSLAGRRGDYLIGVYLHKRSNKFHARCSYGFGSGQSKYLGSFDHEIDAFYAYKRYKESMALNFYQKYKNVLGDDVLQALLSFKVSVTD